MHPQVGDLMHMGYADPEGCACAIPENRDLAIGVKPPYSYHTDGNPMPGDPRFACRLTVKDGRIWCRHS